MIGLATVEPERGRRGSGRGTVAFVQSLASTRAECPVRYTFVDANPSPSSHHDPILGVTSDSWEAATTIAGG
jgi:hypothetical protein